MALFVKHGGKLVDTSPAYGNAESVIGDLAFKEHLTSSLFFATKVWTRDKLEGISQMQKFTGAISDQVDRSGAGAQPG
jgi:diketogulonate reductase-like aldo/keto reductase